MLKGILKQELQWTRFFRYQFEEVLTVTSIIVLYYIIIVQLYYKPIH